MAITLLWILCAALILAGLAGTVLPVLPGTLLVWGGVVLGAWIDDFTRVGVTTLVVVTVLAVLAWGLDYVAGLMGAKKAGASKLALLGAAAGTVGGLCMGRSGYSSCRWSVPLRASAWPGRTRHAPSKSAWPPGSGSWWGSSPKWCWLSSWWAFFWRPC